MRQGRSYLTASILTLALLGCQSEAPRRPAAIPFAVAVPQPRQPTVHFDATDILGQYGDLFAVDPSCPRSPEAARVDRERRLDGFRASLGTTQSFTTRVFGPVIDETKKGNLAAAIEMAQIARASAPNNVQYVIFESLIAMNHAFAGNAAATRQSAALAAARDSSVTLLRDRVLFQARSAAFEVEGQWERAERVLREGLASIEQRSRSDIALMELGERLARVVLLQGRTNEAETILRSAVAGRSFQGLSVDAISSALLFSEIYLRRGSGDIALQMAQKAVNKIEMACVVVTSLLYNDALRMVARVMAASGDWEGAAAQYEKIRTNLRSEPGTFERRYAIDPTLAWSLLKARRFEAAATAANTGAAVVAELLGREVADHGRLRAIQALARANLGQQNVAVADLAQGLSELRVRPASDASTSRLDDNIRREFLALAARMEGWAIAFAIADELRGGAVEKAVVNASARAAVRDPQLQRLAREEQDIRNQMDAVVQAILSAASGNDVGSDVRVLRDSLQNLGRQADAIAARIRRDFPEYAEFVNPAVTSVDEVKSVLRNDEALLFVATDETGTTVWSIGKTGEAAAHRSERWGQRDLAQAVAHLRKALVPDVFDVGDIPDFDLALAHRLYADLFAPLAGGWAAVDTLIFAVDGPLAQLPLQLLITRPVEPVRQERVLFERYNGVPWLIAERAVGNVTSARSLVSLRKVGTANAASEPFAGWGDPVFNGRQLAEFEQQAAVAATLNSATRGTLVRRSAYRDEDGKEWSRRAPSARDVSALARLPETATEVRKVAQALRAPASAVRLGPAATQEAVKRADMSRARVVMFATHGLVAGDLPGLYEPALALSSPEVTGSAGDGLLTMSDILGLRLSADWVVLSACNTAADDGRGSEAISGLGRAFFYAGARALMVTHWPVESSSAEIMTTSTFGFYVEERRLSRAAALREAMLATMRAHRNDERNRALFSYAHPIFWAPFSIYGDPH